MSIRNVMKKILIVVVLILVAIQFITIDKTNPPVDMSKDFLATYKSTQ